MKSNRRVAWLVLLALAETVCAQGPTDAKTLRELTEADAQSWKQITQARLSPDGEWLAYVAAPIWSVRQGGEATIVLRGVHGDTERRYPAGESRAGARNLAGAGNLKMSASGEWVAFHRVPAGDNAAAAIHSRAVLVHVGSGTQHELGDVRQFQFIDGPDESILLEGYPADAGRKTFDVTLRRLGTGEAKTLAGVLSYAVNPAGTRLAQAGPGGLQVHDLRSNRTRVLDALPGHSYESLTWSEQGNALAALRKGEASTALIAFTGLQGARPIKTVLDPRNWTGFPAEHELTPAMKWRDDEHALFFTIQPVPRPVAPVQTVPNLAVWHWRDDRLPGDKKADRNTLPTDWCIVHLARQRFIRLSDATLRDVDLHPRGRYALGYDLNPYGWQNKGPFRAAMAASQPRDYYLVDLQTGERRPLMKGLRVAGPGLSVVPQLSPDGSMVLYQNNDGHYVAHDLRSGAQRNITLGLPTRFYFDENDPAHSWKPRDPAGQGSPLLQGWTRDGEHVLISDHYDVWALPLRGGKALNLTGSARKEDVWYRRRVLADAIGLQPHQSGLSAVDLEAPMYFTAFDLKTGKQGLARRVPGQARLQMLHWEFAEVDYYKAERADVYLYSRRTAVDSRDYYRVGADWQPEKRLTDINPQQREFRWSPGAKYLTYQTANGGTRHAALYLPVGYVEGHSYPTVVTIYKIFSNTIHSYRAPFHTMNVEPMTRRGYAVLMPDIVPRMNEAGRAALADVTAAVEAAVATGVVDRARLGLSGFSYGAYEVNFIVTQTDLFKAVVAWSGATNLWSNCSAVYAERWPVSLGCENDQYYLAGPWWQHWDAYLDNSPLYHARNIRTPLLLLHGDKDDAVAFSNSIELFNTLRGMGGKAVVLLEYKGTDHDFPREYQRDVEQRVTAFFDHFLKDAPAPAWWAEGLSRYEGQVPVGGTISPGS